MTEFFVGLLLYLPLFAISVTCHEFSHAWVADHLGDPTPRAAGRISLNPLRHLDLLGTLLIVVAHFGWAKPVPINPNNLTHPRLQMPLIAAAGPLANLALALVGLEARRYCDPDALPYLMLTILVWLNVMLCVFNLIPLPPLDGSNALRSLLPGRLLYQYDRLAPLGIVALFLAFSVPTVSDAFGRVITHVYQALAQLVA